MPENPIRDLMELTDRNQEVGTPELRQLYQTNPLIGAGGLIEDLTDDQQRFLIAKFMGGTDADAARQCGINVHTMRGWKQHNEEFKQVYDMVTQMPVEMAARVSAFGFAKAVDTIIKMMDANDPKMVMWAIEKMLGIASVGKQRIEVTHKDSKDVGDDDVDRILDRLEQRDRARRTDRTDSDTESGRVL